MDIKEFREHIEKWQELQIASDARILKEILLNTIQCAELWEISDDIINSLVRDKEYLENETERLEHTVSSLEDEIQDLIEENRELSKEIQSFSAYCAEQIC